MNLTLILASLLIFMAVAVATYAAYVGTVSGKDPVAARLRDLRMSHRDAGRVSYGRRPPFLLKLLAQLGGFMPAAEGANVLRTGLVRAGFRGGEAPFVLLGSKALLAAALPLGWVTLSYALARPVGNTVLWAVIFGLAGFYLPTLFIALRQRSRHDDIQRALPDGLDMMVVCVEAGLGIAAALQRVGQEVRVASRSLADELTLVNQEMQTGVSRMDALRHLAERTGVEDVYGLVAMLIQTDKLGTSVAQALRAHAESMRTRRRQRAEQLARKAAIKLVFPLVFLILPALFVVILGPAGIQLLRALTGER